MYTDLEKNDTNYKNIILEPDTNRNYVLILEDDYTFKPLWTSVIKQCLPDAQLDWVQTEEAAERLIQLRRNNGQKYDLIISDIFLSGKKTGIDLWSRHSSATDNFIFVSSLSRDTFFSLVPQKEGSDPIYLQKPLRVSLCIDVIRQLTETNNHP